MSVFLLIASIVLISLKFTGNIEGQLLVAIQSNDLAEVKEIF